MWYGLWLAEKNKNNSNNYKLTWKEELISIFTGLFVGLVMVGIMALMIFIAYTIKNIF